MDWTQVIVILGANISLFLWATRQARTDFLHLDRKLEENRKETNSIIRSIQEDMKDFHVRLERSDVEFKNYLMNQKK